MRREIQIPFGIRAVQNGIAIFAAISFAGAAAFAHVPRPLSLFDKTTAIVTENFYDRTFRGLPWPERVEVARNKIKPNASDAELVKGINDLLSELHASHTEFVSSSDQEYWALQSIFSGKVDGYPLRQIGAWFVRIGTKWFVRNVFRGGPAARAGLLPGDEVLSVDGKDFHPVESFFTLSPVAISYRRFAGAKPERVGVRSSLASFQATLLKATRESFEVFHVGRRRVAYFHLWSGTIDAFKEALAEAAAKADRSSDAMILDLRDGFGGAYPEYLNPFFDGIRDGKAIPAVFGKPLVVLTNEGVRSGKEWSTLILKERGRATLIGTRTKGYFLAGRPFEIERGDFCCISR